MLALLAASTGEHAQKTYIKLTTSSPKHMLASTSVIRYHHHKLTKAHAHKHMDSFYEMRGV